MRARRARGSRVSVAVSPGVRHPLLSRVAGNVGWLLFERLFTLATGFAVNVWFVRYLGPDSYGVYAYAISYTTLFAAVAGLGLDTIVVREISATPERAGDVLGTALGIRAVTGIAASAAIILSTWASRPDRTTLVVVSIVAGSTLFQGLGVFDFWFQAKVMARPAVLTRAAVIVAVNGARCALILLRASLPAFAALFAAGAALTALSVYVLYRRRRSPGGPLAFRRNLVAPLVQDAWPLVVAGVAVNVYMRIDQVMLARMTSTHETGIYATAVTLSELWYILPVSLAQTILPVIVEAHGAGDPERYRRLTQVVYDAMVAGSYVVAIGVSLFSGQIVRVLLGLQYAGAAPIVQVHVWTLVFVAVGVARMRFLIAEGLTRIPMITTVCGGALNVVLNVYLIPRHGGLGAAMATLVAQFLSAYASGAFIPQLRSHTKRISLALVVPFRTRTLRSAFNARFGAGAGGGGTHEQA